MSPAHVSRVPLLQDDRDDVSTLDPSESDILSPSRTSSNNVVRYTSFASAIISCLCAGSLTAFSLYGHLFQTRLHYTQLEVNYVAIAASLALYLPVPIFGYLCDRHGPAVLSFASGIMFGAGYLLAAYTYRSGAGDIGGQTTHRGWPVAVMMIAFIGAGMGTCCMYLSAVATCAKNFGRGKYRGLALALPIASFGLSGMWQSQLGEKIFYEVNPDGSRGDVDVFKYFLFLAFTLLAVGLLGTAGLKVVDEDELIDDAVEELERSGMLEESAFFGRGVNGGGYGSFPTSERDDENDLTNSMKAFEDEEARKKTWLLNGETRRFLKDHTMWWLAAGFFLVTGPGEAYINNLGTIIGTLYPPASEIAVAPTTAATHVSIVAVTSTFTRILTGTLTDLLAPATTGHHFRASAANSISSLPERGGRFTLSRVVFLIAFAILLSIGQALLASGLIQNHGHRFWMVSALIGSGYGAVFSLTPIIITVVWGVENFATNWGIVAMVPALGSTIWGVLYSTVYQRAARDSSSLGGTREDVTIFTADVLCYGKKCYSSIFWAMAICVWIACAMWMWAWRGKDGWLKRGIAV